MADLNWRNLGIKFIVQGQVWNERLRSVDYFLFNYGRSSGSVNGWRLVGLEELLVKAHVI
jgi:hypothetical protein